MKSTMMINALRVTSFAAALLSAGVSSAADVYLQAQSFTKNIPDGGSGVDVPMWGFAPCDSTKTTKIHLLSGLSTRNCAMIHVFISVWCLSATA